MGRSIKRNYLYNLSFQIFSLLIPFITTPYVSRVLHPQGVGIYSYAHSIATYFSLLAALGLASYGLREVSRVRDDPQAVTRLFRELAVLRGLSAAGSFLLYVGFIWLTGSDLKIYLAAGLIIPAAGLDYSWFFQAMENFRALAVRNFLIKIAGVVCIFVFVREETHLLRYILIQAGSTLIGNGVMVPRVRQWLQPTPRQPLQLATHLRATLLYFIPTIATSVYTVLDRTMIGLLTRDMAQNGYYEQAHKIVHMLLTVITSLNVVVGVRTSYLFGQGETELIRRHIRDTFRFMLLLTFPLCFGLLACAETFVPWFYGAGYETVAPMLRLFAPLLFVIGTSHVLGTLYLTPSGQRSRSNRALIAGAVLNVVLNLLLIPSLKAYGAVIASVAAEVVIAGLYLRYTRDYMSLRPFMRMALRYLLLAAGMFLPTYFLGRILPPVFSTTLLQGVVGVVTYGLLLIISRDPGWLICRAAIHRKVRKEESHGDTP